MNPIVKILPVVAILQGCTWYGEFEHISSIPMVLHSMIEVKHLQILCGQD